MRFAEIHDLAQNFKRLDLNKATEKALKARGTDIAELNRDQLRRGQRVDGSTLPPYSRNSVQVFGKPPGAIKLFDTGDFYAGIKPEFTSKDFTLTDTDSKTDMLEDRYGDVIGLQDDSIGELAQDSLGSIQYEIRQQL